MIDVGKASIMSSEAAMLLRELSDELEKITGSSGRISFDLNSMENERSAFFIANLQGKVVGCGAIVEFSNDTAEIKRVYSREHGIGIGKAIIVALEGEAIRLGYQTIILETRIVNYGAVRFYLQNNYQICDNYGKYVGHDEAVCFVKRIQNRT